ncbi:hypothetical protein OIM90_29880 [Streptomyces sp. AD16]|nr:hypothetical protein OIM90_29880 [Streptomyces sp. AD16]
MPEPRPFDRLGPPSWPAPWGILALLLLAGLALIRNGSGEIDGGPPQPAPAAATGARSPPPCPPHRRYGYACRGRDRRTGAPRRAGRSGLDRPATGPRAPPGGLVHRLPAPGTRGASALVGHVDGAEGPSTGRPAATRPT